MSWMDSRTLEGAPESGQCWQVEYPEGVSVLPFPIHWAEWPHGEVRGSLRGGKDPAQEHLDCALGQSSAPVKAEGRDPSAGVWLERSKEGVCLEEGAGWQGRLWQHSLRTWAEGGCEQRLPGTNPQGALHGEQTGAQRR
jgi:hypothetical protein